MIVSLAYPILGILGLVIHIWTIVIAYEISGLVGAAISFMLPVLAQIYWGIAAWQETGTIANPYCLAVIGYFVVLVLGGIGVALADRN
ncbi:MAG: hypothetical protein JSW71_11610 [Gemmatimonadota bacterium]|nr:MAG: hypothetical protein JSW71_11610 [Gemmatimonadota bacterium]